MEVDADMVEEKLEEEARRRTRRRRRRTASRGSPGRWGKNSHHIAKSSDRSVQLKSALSKFTRAGSKPRFLIFKAGDGSNE